MSNETRIVFIVSDGTGITAENFSQSILAQFEASFKHIRIPFVDSVDKAHDAVSSINQAHQKYGVQPIVFTTLVNAELNAIVTKANGLILDMFQTFVAPLEAALGVKSTHAMNRLHHNADTEAYKNRIEAINYSLAHDDGQSNQNLAEADVILVGISRVGKTPTSLYLAMQYGLKAPDDISIVGFDGHEMAEFSELTTIEQPVQLMGEMAAWSIMERLRKPNIDPPSLVLPTTLVVRNSTRRISPEEA